MLKVNFLEYLRQGTLGFRSLSSLLFGASASPQHSHFQSKRISSKYYAATSKCRNCTERAASHIKVTYLPCLFQLLPQENVKRIN